MNRKVNNDNSGEFGADDTKINLFAIKLPS